MKADELLALLERGWLGPPEEWEEAEEELRRLIRTATEKRNIQFFVELIKAFRLEAKGMRVTHGPERAAIFRARRKLKIEGILQPFWQDLVALARVKFGFPQSIHARTLARIRVETGCSGLPDRPRGLAKKGRQKK